MKTNMATCCVLKRSVLNVDGKSFDVVLSPTSLSWGYIGSDDCRPGRKIKYFHCVFVKNEAHSAHLKRRLNQFSDSD